MANREPNIKEKQAEQIAKQLNTPRINETDKGLIRNSFAGRPDLIIAIRNLFFGQATKSEKQMVKETFKSAELKKLMRKVLLPELSPDDPLKQSIDLWQTIDVEIERTPLDDKDIVRIVRARAKLISMLNDALKMLEVPEKSLIDLTMPAVEHISFETLKSRNGFISHVEQQLLMIVIMAGSEPESDEELMSRLRKDSSK